MDDQLSTVPSPSPAPEPLPQQPAEAVPQSPPPPPELPKKTWTGRFLAVVAGLLILGGIAYGALWYWQNNISDVAIPSVSPRPNTPATVTASQRFVVTQGIAYDSSQMPSATHFSIFAGDGSLFKTIDIPADSLFAGMSTVKISGNKIYYMSGTQELTSLGEIDIQTGKARTLPITQVANTNIGNTYSGIIGWAVASDNSKIAWLNTDGQIIVANTDGTNIKIYSSGVSKPIISDLHFGANSIYFTADNKLMKIDLISGLVSSEGFSLGYAISDSGRYLANINPDYSLDVHDFTSGTDIHVHSNDRTLAGSTMVFSPDETRLIFSQPILPGQDKTELNIVDLKTGTVMPGVKNYGILGFASSSRLVVFDSNLKPLLVQTPYIVDLDGKNSKALPDEEFLGIIEAGQ